MSNLIASATLAPDNGATVESVYARLLPGESVSYSVAWVAGATQDVAFQYTDSPGQYWVTVEEVTGLSSGAADISGTFKNTTRGVLYLRFRSTETNGSSTDEQATVAATSVSDALTGLDVRTDAGVNLITFEDEFIRFHTRLGVGYDGSSNDRLYSGASGQSMARLIYGLLHADTYGFYTRSYIGTAGISADAARLYATVDDVAAGTVRGLHCSLSFASTGDVTGLGVAAEFTLHINNSGGMSGTIAAAKFAINSDGATSDPAGSSLSYVQFVNQGNATGGADVDDDVGLFDIVGHTVGAGNLVETATTETDFSHAIKIKIDGTPYWLMAIATLS